MSDRRKHRPQPETPRLVRIKLTPEQLDPIFENAKTQEEYIMGVFALIIPRWDEVVSTGQLLKGSKNLCLDLMERGMAWDKKHLPGQVMPGGAMINYGLSLDESLPDWTAAFDASAVKYKLPAGTPITTPAFSLN